MWRELHLVLGDGLALREHQQACSPSHLSNSADIVGGDYDEFGMSFASSSSSSHLQLAPINQSARSVCSELGYKIVPRLRELFR